MMISSELLLIDSVEVIKIKNLFSFKLNRNDQEQVDENLKNDIKLSVIEGSFATIMGTLIGGAFLTGFALILGANNFIIGILASIPLLANLVQIVGSYIISRMGNSKKVCIIYVFLHRLLWIGILILPFFVFRSGLSDIRIWIFVVLLGIASICASITSVSWMSWMSDLIPREIRGRFFARRNTAARVVGMLLAVAAGRFVDYWNGLYTGNSLLQSYGFTILFTVGTAAGFISIILMKRISNPVHRQVDTQGFIKRLTLPIRDKNFKRFILFSVIWGFSVSIVGPFFNVYMIKNLGIPFSLISIFGVVSGVSAILGLKFIGKMSDEYGPKPLFFVCGIGGAIIPFLWIFATPANYSIIWFINILSGACWAGIGLASSSMMMNLAPQEHNSVYFAVFAAITGVFGALAPICGGFLGVLINGLSINLGFYTISGLQILFIVSTVMRGSSLLLLRPVSLTENVTVSEMLAAMRIWHRFFPANRIFSITSHTGNFFLFLNRGMITFENRLENLIIEKGKRGLKKIKFPGKNRQKDRSD